MHASRGNHKTCIGATGKSGLPREQVHCTLMHTRRILSCVHFSSSRAAVAGCAFKNARRGARDTSYRTLDRCINEKIAPRILPTFSLPLLCSSRLTRKTEPTFFSAKNLCSRLVRLVTSVRTPGRSLFATCVATIYSLRKKILRLKRSFQGIAFF